MAETPVNFLGGSPLNRLSWLRNEHKFLNTIIPSPTTRWVLFQGGQPLVTSRSKKDVGLAWLTTAEVRSFLGPDPYFGQGQKEGELVAGDNAVLEASRFRGSPIVFLGLKEPSADAGTTPNKFIGATPEEVARTLKGTPYFSLDVTDADKTAVDQLLQSSDLGKDGSRLFFSEPRNATTGMNNFEAAVFAEARSMVDWNSRNQFCPACGSPEYSLWGGWKLSCSSLLPWADNTGRKPCPTEKGLHNFTHPRTDPVVIMAVLNEAQDKILLGRGKKFPSKFFSTLAGFIEPGESFEDAVKRELWEEAGIHVHNVKYHSGQPWPYPANLMIGYYATGDPNEPIRLDLDKELEDARWYTREEVLAVLNHEEGTNFTRRDWKTIADNTENRVNVASKEADPFGDATAVDATGAAVQAQPVQLPPPAADEPAFRVPPRTAIGGVLISDWAHGKWGKASEQSLIKGKI